MSRQIVILCRLWLCNLFGFNEFRYTKDEKRKKRFLGMTAVWIVLILMLVCYVAAFSIGFIQLGMAEIVPMYLYTVVSLLILFLTFFKASSTLFSLKGYEMLAALPFSRTAIVISRFLGMYVTNLLAGLLIMVPGVVVYGYFVRPGIWFYLVSFIATVFLPLLPLTIASVLGAGITAISTRIKHRSLGESVLMMFLVVVIMVGSMMFSGQTGQMDVAVLKDLAENVSVQIGHIYPPALWFQKAIAGNAGFLMLLLAVPAAIFVCFAAIIQRYFHKICMALNAVAAKNNYKMKSLHASGVTRALWKKELKRYFASSVYVSNTLVGYVLAVVAAVAMLILGPEKIMGALQFPGMGETVRRCLPFGIAFLLSMIPMTSCSISMEGGCFWQIQTLPVRGKEVYNSKILANLTVAAPFYFVTAVLLCIAMKPTLAEAIWIFVIPACYLIFMAVVGITVNLAFPILNWENEVRVVKQSASTMVTMLIGMAGSLIPLAGVIVLPEDFWAIWNGIVVVLLFISTVVLYSRNNKKSLMECIR